MEKKEPDLVYEDGGKYWGDMSRQEGTEVPHGKGRYEGPDGSSYDGEWEMDMEHGYGVFRYSNGNVYEGSFQNGEMCGQGKMVFLDGVVAEGQWKAGVMHGKIKLVFADGRVYEGDMSEGKRTGWGKETKPTGEYNEGTWLNNKLHGKAFSCYCDGNSYDGDYVDGRRTGWGKFTWKNGMIYEGQFQEGKRHGKGIQREPDGSWYSGVWDENHIVERGPKQSPPPLAPEEEEDEEEAGALTRKESLTIINATNGSACRVDFDDEMKTPVVDLTDWKKGNILGKGSFGEVYLGLLKNGKFIAVKTVVFGKECEEDLKAFQAELDVMKSVHHPNVVQYLGSEFQEDLNMLNIFMEYMPQGSIAGVAKKFNPLPVTTIRTYTRQIIAGLTYLHSVSIVHRDIKGDNILLDSHGVAKLADLGCSKQLQDLTSRTHGCSTMVGTPYWMAPEVITNTDGYGCSADVWSVGCTVLEMLTAKPPWPEMASMWSAIYHIANSTGPPELMPTDLQPDLNEFLLACFERDVKRRPTAQQLMDMQFLQPEDAP
uniref:Protein kinase domain-containing protein n=1 Tax=Eutreptiella gymnastica TaxID=73025 RepID=A0A7S1HX39_9EUGL|mmetsp:Transcript_11189/g.20146  ORF Transcript_11189/g.20146 Transcript_11189/m.20146 type:complete len:541 (+) Transcript_11189:102-1724(+)